MPRRAGSCPRADVGCSLCGEPCHNQRCEDCRLPLCPHCVSRPHQCARRKEERLAKKKAHSSREEVRGSSEWTKGMWGQQPDALLSKPEGFGGESTAPNESGGRELSANSVGMREISASSAGMRDLSSSSINSTESTASSSSMPWHMSQTSQDLFSEYFQRRQVDKKDKNDTCVSQ